MKFYNRFKTSVEGFSKAFSRFPLTALFLIVFTVLDGMMIASDQFEFEKYLAALAVGVFLSAVFQMVYERFCIRSIARVMLMALAAILTLGYYLIIRNAPELGMEIGIKTGVALFGLLIGFLWIPSIKSRVSFNETSMAGFKYFFISFFFSGVLMMGLSLIYGATDQLLFDVDEDIYAHTANIVFFLFATMYFLSLIPRYPGIRELMKEEGDGGIVSEEISKAIYCPKYLEILLSYIVIPLSMVFTFILLMYIVINIRGRFWQDALLEPMLVSYIGVVIVLYILTSNVENQPAKAFRKIFPKVLLPIVLFQTVNSFLKIGDLGFTHGRYYVILFGIFAFISGLVFSFKPVEKNGIVAMVLMIFITVSILPPVDAFTLSRVSQTRMLENILINKGMLADGEIVAKSDIEEQSKSKITEMARYLHEMDYDDNIEWIPEDFDFYSDFEDVFGFAPYRDYDNYYNRDKEEYYHVYTDLDEMIEIGDYDRFIQTYIGMSNGQIEGNMDHEFEYRGKSYRILNEVIDGDYRMSLIDHDGYVIMTILGQEIVDSFKDEYDAYEAISVDDATVIYENDKASVKLVVQNLSVDGSDVDHRFDAEIYLFIKIK
jgi:hypothetical protein